MKCSLLVVLVSGVTKSICFAATGALLKSLSKAALLSELKWTVQWSYQVKFTPLNSLITYRKHQPNVMKLRSLISQVYNLLACGRALDHSFTCSSLKHLHWHRDSCNGSDIRVTILDNKHGINIIYNSTSNLNTQISYFIVHILNFLPDIWTARMSHSFTQVSFIYGPCYSFKVKQPDWQILFINCSWSNSWLGECFHVIYTPCH